VGAPKLERKGMNLQKQITVVFFILLFSTPFVIRWYYVKLRPRPQAIVVVREEVNVTIIPGWNLRNVADYLIKIGFASTTEQVFALTGEPASNQTKSYDFGYGILSGKKSNLSLEGYLAPETYRVFKDATLADVIKKFIDQRQKQLTSASSSVQNWHEILTMASLIEDEARTPEDRRLVSDILRRRLAKGWALQLDSTVHYAVDKTGTVFTTDRERDSLSLWNTYKYPGLPPGPISNPSLDSIDAALNPTKNDNWYFLSGTDGKMHYATTLEEHTANRYKYLR
jgi:UPF0755 protein